MRFLLDSNALQAFVDHHYPLADQAVDARNRGHRVVTCDPVIAEIYLGLQFSESREMNMKRLKRALSRMRSWPFDRNAALEYARLAADLKRRGRPMQIFDMLIAAVALSVGNCTVVTTDSDFSAVPGLSVVDWTIPPPANG